MTTQHTHPEHNDADFSAEEPSSASETGTTSSWENFTPTAPESHTSVHNPGVAQSSPFAEHASSKEENTTAAGDAIDSQANTSVSPTTTPFGGEEPVRPFSDFIKEFRQTEGRFQTALEAYAVETQQSVNEHDPVPTNSASASAKPTETIEDTSATEAATAEKPTERPVSPLLRPASRLRGPRHSNTRHREPAANVETPATASTEAEAPQPTNTPNVETPTANTSQAGEALAPASAEEQPRPPRRYRFDRPAATDTRQANEPGVEKEILSQSAKPTNNNAPTTEQTAPKQPVAQETTLTEATPAVQEQDRRRKHGHERPAFNGKEQSQAQVQAQPSATPVGEAPAPAATEPVAPLQAEVSPEDLPPLEYSELQKASSRRRRRRPHPGTSATPGTSAPASTLPGSATNAANPVNTAKTVTPEVPAAQQPSAVTSRMPVPSVVPTPTPTPTGQYSITSGYTVSQMNQGNGDGTSPFMGPDPSPARGTIAAQKTRSIRTDAQRTPVYPIRSTEPNPASVQQIANVITQSFQIQTDRMIAEMRRAGQGPTNISVSVPHAPFQ